MRTFTRSALVGMMLTVLAAGQPVRGQTTSPGTAAGAPSAQQLVNQAVAAFRKAGSAHLTSSLKAAVAGPSAGQVTVALEGDVAWRRPAAAHITGTMSLGIASMQQALASMPVELVYANQQVAVRAGTRAWSCRNLQGLAKTSGTPAESLQLQSQVNLGSETLAGTAVWHVRETGTVVATPKTGQTVKLPTSVDLYIAQAGLSLLRLTETTNATAGQSAIVETGSVDFSKYGEVVQAILPAACGSQAARWRGLNAQLAEEAKTLLNPLALVRQLRAGRH